MITPVPSPPVTVGLTPDWVTIASVTAIVASSIIALSALVFSIVSFRRQQSRADQQQLRAERLATARVKPLLWIQRQKYDDLKSMSVRNFGLGPAIVRYARITKAGQPATTDIVELFDIRRPEGSSQIVWEKFAGLPEKRAIAAHGEVVLIKESLEHLENQGIDRQLGLKLLDQWEEQAKQIEIDIEYDDILGNRMEPLKFTWQ